MKAQLKTLMSYDYSVIEKQIYNKTNVAIHFRPFKLNWLDLEKSCTKSYKDEEYEILNLSKDILLIINKVQNNVKINDIDFEKTKYEREPFIEKIKETIIKLDTNKKH